jgi:hypothetical protein
VTNYQEELSNHLLYSTIREDGQEHLHKLQDENLTGEVHLPEEIQLDELEYYIHNVGFWTAHFSSWFHQLNIGVELLSNFSYNKKTTASRFDHLAYNIENYIIRFQSVQDKLLHIVNAVFHLTINERKVNFDSVMTNLKVYRTDIPNKFKPVKTYLNQFQRDRNTIIHRHSYLEKELRRLELFYHPNNDDMEPRYKQFRTRQLTKYITEKKGKFNEQNEQLLALTDQFLTDLLPFYIKQRNRLIKELR